MKAGVPFSCQSFDTKKYYNMSALSQKIITDVFVMIIEQNYLSLR